MKKTELILQKDKIAPIDDRIFGNFIEHIENCILDKQVVFEGGATMVGHTDYPVVIPKKISVNA